MSSIQQINYIDGGTTTTEFHSTKPIIYYNKLNHIFEHNYLTNDRRKLHSFISPIRDVFHVSSQNNELIVMDNQTPPSLTLFDTLTCTVKSVVWSKLKTRSLQSFIAHNSEQNSFIFVHKISESDIMIEPLRIKDEILVSEESQIFTGIIDLIGVQLLGFSKTITSIVLYGTNNIMIMNIEASNGNMSFKSKFSVAQNILKIRSHAILQIFAVLNNKHEIDFYDCDGLSFHKIESRSSKFIDFVLKNNSLRTLEEDGTISVSNLTKLHLALFSKIDKETINASSLKMHKTLDHILAFESCNMAQIVEYKANKSLITFMLNNEEWETSTLYNKNLFLFSRLNTSGVYKQRDGKRFIEYYMLDGFEDGIVCTAQHSESILIGTGNGKIAVFDPLEMKIKQIVKVAEGPILAIESTLKKTDHVLIRTTDKLALVEISPILRSLKTIETIDPLTTSSLKFIGNRGFGNYGVVSYSATYCVTSKLLRVVEINITSQFVDCNPLFEYEVDEDIVDFAVDQNAKDIFILHDHRIVQLNKITGLKTEIMAFDVRASKFCVENNSNSFFVLLQMDKANRSIVETYNFKDIIPRSRVEYNYRVKTIHVVNEDIIAVAEQRFIESRSKILSGSDVDFFHGKKSALTNHSQLYNLSINIRTDFIEEAQSNNMFIGDVTQRSNKIKDSQIDIVQQIRSKYIRRPFESLNNNNEASFMMSKGNSKVIEVQPQIDYRDSLRRLAGTYARSENCNERVQNENLLVDPQDIDD